MFCMNDFFYMCNLICKKIMDLSFEELTTKIDKTDSIKSCQHAQDR